MKTNKIITLAAALLIGATAVGCQNPGSSEEVLTPEQVVSEAADFLWQMYRVKDDTEITNGFDVVNVVSIGSEKVSVSWALEVTGAQGGYEVKKKDDNFSTIYVGYKDGLVTEDSTVKLIPTLTLGEISKTFAEIFADDAKKHAIDFTTPGLVLNSNEAYLVEIKAEELGLTKDPSTFTKTVKAVSEDNKEVEVVISCNNLYIDYGAVYLNRGVENDTFVISAPLGYAVTKLEVVAYNTHDNLNFHAGKDATAPAITEDLVGDSAAKRGYYTLAPNSRHVTIDNPQSDYGGSFYNVKISVAQAGPALQIGSEDFGLTTSASDIVKTEKAGDIDVTFTLNKLFIKYDAVYMDKNIEGDTFVNSVPEGHKIVALEVEAYGTFDNLNFHVGQDATGEAIDEGTPVTDKTAKRCYYAIEPNCQHVTIDNPQTDHTGSFYTVKVVVA